MSDRSWGERPDEKQSLGLQVGGWARELSIPPCKKKQLCYRGAIKSIPHYPQ